MRGDGIWQAVGGKRPCDGCNRQLRTEDVQVIATSAGLVFCGSCWEPWAHALRHEVETYERTASR